MRTQIIGMMFLSFCFIKCASTQFEKHPPFKIIKATINNTSKEVVIEYSSEKLIEFDSLFLKKQILKANTKTLASKKIVYAELKQNDLILSGDAKEEFGNKPTIIEQKKFNLEENEMVISYKDNQKTKYTKINTVLKN